MNHIFDVVRRGERLHWLLIVVFSTLFILLVLGDAGVIVKVSVVDYYFNTIMVLFFVIGLLCGSREGKADRYRKRWCRSMR